MQPRTPKIDISTLAKDLTQGPRNKTQATIVLEKIIQHLLFREADCSFNPYNELEIKIDGHIYNLTSILRAQPDFEHFELNDNDLKDYVNFIHNKAKHKPIREKGASIPSDDDYNRLDPNSLCSYIPYPEKLAITLYTGDFYEPINQFLRQYGQVNEYELLEKDQLNLRVREILLCAAIASIGLNRVPPEKEVLQQTIPQMDNKSSALQPNETATKPGLVYRNDKVADIDKERMEEIAKSKTTIQRGFTSSSRDQKYFTNAEEQNTKLPGSRTAIIYQQAQSINPIGKHIQVLSRLVDEDEVLFPPNTQFKYYYYGIENGLHVFEGTPIRSLDDIKPHEYDTKMDSLRSELIHALRYLKENSNYLSYDVNDLMAFKEIFFKRVAHDPLQLDYFKSCFNDIDQLINIAVDMQNNRELLEHVERVYQLHLSQPYQDTDKYSVDAIYHSNKNVVIHRPNHGLAHTLRVTLYLKPVIEYYARFAKDTSFKKFCANIPPRDMKLLELAALFFVTGRESELGFVNNKDKYLHYRATSFEQFKTYARNHGVSDIEIQKYRSIITGEELYEGFGKDQSERQYLYNIILSAHNYDLMRCFSEKEYAQKVDMMRDLLVNPSPEQQQHENDLLTMVTNTTQAMGDRLITKFENGKLIPSRTSYQSELFVTHSTNPEKAMGTCLENRALIKNVNAHDEIQPKVERTHAEVDDIGSQIKWLLFATKMGLLDLVQSLLKTIRLEALNQYSNRDLILIAAIEGNHAAVLGTLINHGFDINQTYNGLTPLAHAIEQGSESCAQLLIKRGAHINALTPDGLNLLQFAITKKNKAIVELLIAHGANMLHEVPGKLTPLEMIIELDDADMLRIFINEFQVNEDQNIKNLDPIRDRLLIQAILDLAIIENDANRFVLAVKLGADLNKIINGMDAIQRIIKYNALEVFKAFMSNMSEDQEYVHHIFETALLNKNMDVLKFILQIKDIALNKNLSNGLTALEYAIQTNQINLIELLVTNNEAANFIHAGKTPLLFAASIGNGSAVEILLRNKNIDIYATESTTLDTALHYALTANDEAMSKALIMAGANPLAKNITGKSPLLIAYEKNEIDLLNLLTTDIPILTRLASNQFEKDYLFFQAIKNRDMNSAKFLLDQGANPNFVFHNTTAFKTAITNFSLEMSQLINDHYIDRKGTITASGNLNDNTFTSFSDFVYQALIHNPDTNLTTPNHIGFTPLHMIIMMGNEKLFKKAMDSIDNNCEFYEAPETMLQSAVKNGKTFIINRLLLANANPNIVGQDDKKTPLVEAIEQERLDIVQLLLNNEPVAADPNQLSKNQVLPLAAAILLGKHKIVKCLVEHGAEPNAKTKDSSMLELALLGNKKKIIFTLFEYGADPTNAMDHFSKFIKKSLEKDIVPLLKALNSLPRDFIINPSDIQLIKDDIKNIADRCIEYLSELSAHDAINFLKKLNERSLLAKFFDPSPNQMGPQLKLFDRDNTQPNYLHSIVEAFPQYQTHLKLEF